MTSPFEDKSGPSLISRGRRYVLTDDQPGGLSRGKRCQAAPETAYIERPSPEGAGSTSDTHGAPSLRSGFSSLGSLVASYPPGVTESPCSVTVSTGYGTLSPESRNKKPLDYDHVLCDSCVSRLHVLRRQALRLLIHNKDSEDASVVPLCAIEAWYESDGQCDVCATNLRQLKQKALHTILTQEQAIWARDPSPAGLSSPRPPKRAPGPNTLPRTSSPCSSPAKPVLKSSGQGKGTSTTGQPCLEAQWSALQSNGASLHRHQMSQSTAATPEATTPTATSTAVAFFVRAVQKLNLSSRRKKPCSALPSDVDAPSRVTDFCGLLLRSPPLVPRHLLQASTPGKPTPGTGKGQVKVMLRVSPVVDSCLKLDGRRKQVTILDPITHNPQQQTTASKVTPRSFTFDAVFTPESMQGEVCESALPGPLQAVMNGADGCIIGFGRAGTGKSYTMTGKDDSILSLGVIPCAISWLFRLVSKRREKTGAEISVSITATEVYGRNEVLRDLLYTEDMSNFGNGQKPGICLCEDPVSGIQLMNQSVVSAPTAERAASLLDIALSSRSGNRPGVSSHMFFTLHVHQQHTQGPTKDVVCGGQSRLILIDLGSCVEEHSKSMAQLSFPELSSVMLTLLRGGKQVPNRNSKLTMLLQESLGNVNCQTTVIAHVSGSTERLSDTLSTLQIIARIHKMQRKAKKSRSSSPSERSVRKEKKLLQETKLRAFHSTGTLGPDVPAPKLFRDKEDRSGSDLSCDTVIHVDSDGCNTDMNKKPQESISIIPSLLKSKTVEIANPLQAMKQRPQRTFLKDFRLIHRSQEEKETKMSATQEAEMEYFKCSTFAELQERLGCIDGSELISQGQSTEAVGKVQPLPEAKKEAEKTDIANPVPSIQENTEGNGYRTACETKIIDTGLIDSFQSDPTDHKEIPSDRPLADNLGNPADSRSQTSASDSDQCSAELEMTKSQGQSSDESLLHPEYRISPIGKSSSKSSSSGSSLSSSSMSASTDSPITLTDTTPQLSAEGQREMRATITVTVQQPFDLNGQDELVYTVVEEVTISGMAEKGRPTNVISFSEGSSLQALTTGSQPVRIISSVSEDASMLDSSAKNGALERQPLLTSQERYELTSNQVSSNKPETHGVHSGASVEGLYQPSSRELENQTKTQSSMACEMAQHASSTLINSGGKPSLEKLQCGYTPSQDLCKKKLEVIKEMPSPAKSMDNPWKAYNQDAISNNNTPKSSFHQGIVRKTDAMSDNSFQNSIKNDAKKSKDLDINMFSSRANGYHSPTQNEAKKCKDKDVNVFSSRVKLDQKTSGVTRDPTTEFRPEKKATGKKASQLNKHQSFKGEAIMSPASRRRLVDAYDLTRSGSLNSKHHRTASLPRAWHSLDQEDGFEDDYPTSPAKDCKVLGEAMSTPCSPGDTLERRHGRAKQGIFVRAKENFSTERRDSPDQKRRASSQSSLPRSPVLQQKSSFHYAAPDDSCRRKHIKSPIEESSKLFSAKLEQLSSRAPNGNAPRSEFSDYYFSEQDSFMTSTESVECFEGDCTLPRASRSGKRYPKFLPMDDQDADCSISASRSNLSKASAVSKLMMSSSKPSRSSASSAKTMNLITKSLRQSFRSSSLSPDGTSSGHGSWSTQSLSRSQGSSFSSIKIMNGRITELLRGNGDPVSGVDQGGSEYKEKGAAKSNERLPLPSPYSRVTAPRLPSHCSGRASDTTSILSGELPPAMGKTSLLCNRNSVVSSGYESLMRDSSATGSSMSIRESTSDHSCTHSLARSGRSSKRKTNSAAGTSQRRPSQETLLSLRRSASGPRVRWGDRGAADSYEIKVYEIDNVDCLQRRGLCSNRGVACFSAKLKFLEHRQQRIVELRSKYNHLKRELEQAKQYLMLDPEKWSQEFDLWQTFEVDSLEHLEALELVTARLESRLNQCKAHTMMVTCFDAAPKRRQKRTKRHRPSPDQKGFL
ncbi:kinesin-like protein KIF26B [Alosa sapidissima]|uniref:kinesin-like protein KIF26B n=1 Tax=Alosa sapidissima TaxID=34773 RepID=UPI001C08D9BB|nr:kinesin-like protein KIF26B [Alosa sapidissima]